MSVKTKPSAAHRLARLALATVLACALCLPTVPAFGVDDGADAPVLTLDGGKAANANGASGNAADQASSGNAADQVAPAVPSVRASNKAIAGGRWGTCEWELYEYESGNELVVHPGKGTDTKGKSPWAKTEDEFGINRVKFKAEGGKYIVCPKDCSGLFEGITADFVLDGIDTRNTTNMDRMFAGSFDNWDGHFYLTWAPLRWRTDVPSGWSHLNHITFPTGFSFAKVTSMKEMFAGNDGLHSVDLSCADTANVADMSGLFKGCENLESFYTTSYGNKIFSTAKVTNMSHMFAGCVDLCALDLSLFDTGNVTNMSHMFEEASSDALNTDSDAGPITSLDLSTFNTAKVANMASMFKGCDNLVSLNLSGLDASQVTDMSSMFRECRELSSIDFTGFKTGNVVNMASMFENCGKLASLNLSGFRTEKATDMSRMFANCESLASVNVLSFKTPNVTSMASMFEGCSKLKTLNLSSFNTVKVGNMSDMFSGCSKLETLDISNFNTTRAYANSLKEPVGFKGISGMFGAIDRSRDRSYENANLCWALKKISFGNNFFPKGGFKVVSSWLMNSYSVSLPATPDGYFWHGKGGSYSSANLWYDLDNRNPSGTYVLKKVGSFSQAKVAPIPDQMYDGSAKEPDVTVKYDGMTLGLDGDTAYNYGARYSNNVNVGTATVTLEGTEGGHFAGKGTVKATFRIVPASLAKATVASIANQRYTGKAIKPNPSVKLGSKTLKSGTDYTLSYKNNTKVGTATLTVIGKGNYTGSVSKTFKITGGAAAWERLWGTTQFDTMERIVQKGWGRNSGGTVIIATGDNFPDALSASGVAGVFGAPVLLVQRASMPAKTASELKRINPTRVIIAGGPGAILPAVEAAVKRAAPKASVKRCYGTTATDTAAALNRTYFGKRSDTAILATSLDFYDALAAAPVAYAKHYPIFLAEGKNSISRNTLSAMKACGIKKVIVVGGTGVVSDGLVNRTLRQNGISLLKRLGGWDYYDTSREIAKWAVKNGMSADRVGVATSFDYYDALTGAALCGKNKAVLVLADSKSAKNVNNGQYSFTKAYKAAIARGYVFGGRNAVSEAVLAACKNSTK